MKLEDALLKAMNQSLENAEQIHVSIHKLTKSLGHMLLVSADTGLKE